MPQALRVVVLLSGKGSNLGALLEAIAEGRCRAQVRGVVADRRSCGGLSLAASHGIESAVVRPRDFEDREQWDTALAEKLSSFEPELVVSAGFMRLLGDEVLARFGGRTINLHPSLLPAFPGLDAAGQAIRAGVRISGCTVHLVDQGMDTGPILAQAAVPVLLSDQSDQLHARIQKAEHRLLPSVVDRIARGELLPLAASAQDQPQPHSLSADGSALFSPELI